ncbi:hypothetical protein, partial [Plasmodium yoelii yoelii]
MPINIYFYFIIFFENNTLRIILYCQLFWLIFSLSLNKHKNACINIDC